MDTRPHFPHAGCAKRPGPLARRQLLSLAAMMALALTPILLIVQGVAREVSIAAYVTGLVVTGLIVVRRPERTR
jgi:hypothetical protein